MTCTVQSIMPLQQSDSLGLVVISEEDTHRTLLIHRIVFDDIYYRQGGMVQPHNHACITLFCTARPYAK